MLKETRKLYNYLKVNDKKFDYEKSLNTYLEDELWYDYECETIKKHDYETFFNVTLQNDNHDLKTPKSVTTKPQSQESLFKKIKNLLFPNKSS